MNRHPYPQPYPPVAPPWVQPQRQLVPVVVRPKRTPNNGLHLILTLVTCGAWFPVWIIDMAVCAASKAKIEYR